MRAKLTGTDAYLAEWRRGGPVPCGDDSRPRPQPRPKRWRPSITAERLRELGRQRRRTAEPPDVRRPPLVDPPCRLLGAVLPRASSGRCVAARPAAAAHRLRAPGAPAAAVERSVKGLLFDCQMCGQCVLSSTGMSCPMNCPKQLRNGPCGGVRADGHCEVKPEMRCVWVQAWEGRGACASGDRSPELQPPVDHRRRRAARPGCASCASALGADVRTGRFDARAGPGRPAADLPGHTRAAGSSACCAPAVRRHLRAEPARFGRSARGLRPGARCCPRLRATPSTPPTVAARTVHMSSVGDLRAADPRRLRAGHADLLPRQEPHRDPGRHPGRAPPWASPTSCA